MTGLLIIDQFKFCKYGEYTKIISFNSRFVKIHIKLKIIELCNII